MPTRPIIVNELKYNFFSIKTNKCPGYDEINFNVITSCFGKLSEPLQYLFTKLNKKSMFLDDMKIAKVPTVFKSGDNTELINCGPISVVPCSSKILERVMYNRLYKYLLDSNILYKNQFDFQEGHSTDCAILKLADQIHNNFEQNNFTLGVFTDLPEAFVAVDPTYYIKN